MAKTTQLGQGEVAVKAEKVSIAFTYADLDLEAKTLLSSNSSITAGGNVKLNANYAAMVESMDDAVGMLLDTLERLGIADRTIVIFFSDNGGNMYERVGHVDRSVPVGQLLNRSPVGLSVFHCFLSIP